MDELLRAFLALMLASASYSVIVFVQKLMSLPHYATLGGITWFCPARDVEIKDDQTIWILSRLFFLYFLFAIRIDQTNFVNTYSEFWFGLSQTMVFWIYVLLPWVIPLSATIVRVLWAPIDKFIEQLLK